MALSLAQVKTILDSLAKQAQNIIESGFNANSTGYANNRVTVMADIFSAADLAAAFEVDISTVGSFGYLYDQRRKALDAHVGGINNYLLTNDSRACEFLRSYMGWNLPALNTFCNTPTKLSDFTVTGASTGTTTLFDGFAVGVAGKIDLTKYGKTWLRANVTTLIGAGVLTVTVVGVDLNGNARSKVATIASGATAGQTFNCGTLGLAGDDFAQITSITISGGTSGAFKIETVPERVIAL